MPQRLSKTFPCQAGKRTTGAAVCIGHARRRKYCASAIFTTSAIFNLDSSHPMSHSHGMTTPYEASLRTGAVLTRTAPFPNDPPTAVTVHLLGISMLSLGLRSLRSGLPAWPPEPASPPEDLPAGTGAFIQIYTALYTRLHTHLHRFTHHLHAIYTPLTRSIFRATTSGPIISVKNLPLGLPPPPPQIYTLNPSTDRRKKVAAGLARDRPTDGFRRFWVVSRQRGN